MGVDPQISHVTSHPAGTEHHYDSLPWKPPLVHSHLYVFTVFINMLWLATIVLFIFYLLHMFSIPFFLFLPSWDQLVFLFHFISTDVLALPLSFIFPNSQLCLLTGVWLLASRRAPASLQPGRCRSVMTLGSWGAHFVSLPQVLGNEGLQTDVCNV